MSFVIAAPETVASAAADVAGIGSSLSAANVAVAAPTTRVLAAAGDEVSAAIASLFSSHGQEYQALSAQAAASLFGLPTLCDQRLGLNELINFNAGDHSLSVSMRYADYIRVERPELGQFAE